MKPMSSSQQSSFKQVALIGRYHTPGVASNLAQLSAFLRQRGCGVLLERETARNCGMPEADALDYVQIGAQADLAVVLGGDGSMLNAARHLACYGVPLVGVNQGRLGFMTDIAASDMLHKIGQLLDGLHSTEQRALLTARVLREGKPVFETLALNDVVVNKGAASRLVELQVHVDGQFVFDLRADGLIIATPTGSTAYALSSNGPIMHPDLRGLVLVPISPHTLSNRPIALSDRAVLDITLVRAADARLHFDGQPQYDLIEGDQVVVQQAPHAITFVHPPGYSYYAMLREKLHWSESL